MNHDLITFENFSHENGVRFWYADAFAEYLGYQTLDSFRSVIRKARISSEEVGVDIEQEFIPFEDQQGKKNYKLTRFACLLCALHADDRKPKVRQTRVFLAKFADYASQNFDVQRLENRRDLSTSEKIMEEVVHHKGLPSEKFGLFKNSGYRGMYNMGLKDLKKRKGVPENVTLYDFMGGLELAANNFRVLQTAESIRVKNITDAETMNKVAHDIGKKVRDMVIENTSQKPEDLQIEKKITHAKSEIKKVHKKMTKHDKK